MMDRLFDLYCRRCERPIQSQELAVIVAYVMISEGHTFSLRTTDLFHNACWHSLRDEHAERQKADAAPPSPPLERREQPPNQPPANP